MRKALILCIALIVGNFIYQYFTGGNYELASERSYFQCIAIAWHSIYIRCYP